MCVLTPRGQVSRVAAWVGRAEEESRADFWGRGRPCPSVLAGGRVASVHDVRKSASRGFSVADVEETTKVLGFTAPTETEGGSAVLKVGGPRAGQPPLLRGYLAGHCR